MQVSKKKISFIAQFPPPIHGLSKAVETLFNSDLNKKFSFEKIDITENKLFIKNIIAILKSSADLFYFTISQTKRGNLRDLIILIMLNLFKKKCLIHLHGGYYRKLVDNDMKAWQRKLNYYAIKNVAGVIVLGPSLKGIFQGMVDEEKIFVVSNCVDDEFLISDAEFKFKVAELKNKTVLQVLYLSNFIRSKGYREVLEMARLEKERVAVGGSKRLIFNFAGKFFDHSEREYFEKYIEEYELQDFVKYHGIVGGQQKKNLLKQCNIFILLTNYPNEGQPISILEAMANGMVIITTNHAGIPDIVQDDINGIVVSPNKICVNELFHRILTTFEEDNGESIIFNNRKCILTYYNQTSYLNKINQIYELF